MKQWIVLGLRAFLFFHIFNFSPHMAQAQSCRQAHNHPQGSPEVEVLFHLQPTPGLQKTIIQTQSILSSLLKKAQTAGLPIPTKVTLHLLESSKGEKITDGESAGTGTLILTVDRLQASLKQLSVVSAH